MVTKTIAAIALIIVAASAISCSIFTKTKKTSVTKTENSVERTPSGTIEKSTVSTVMTVTEKNPKTKIPPPTPVTPTSEPSVPSFGIVTETIRKGDGVIYDTMKPTTSKLPTNISEAVFTEDSIIRDGDFDCHYRIVEINARSSTFMNADYEAQGQHIYPGAIYNYNDFKTGNYKELTADRNVIKLTTDVPNITGATWTIVDNPEESTIRDGIAGLYGRFDNRLVGTMNLRYQTFASNTEAEYSLRLSGGASFAGFSLENEYKNTTQTTRHYVTIDAVKPLYTIKCKLPYAKNYFKSSSPVDSSKHPVVISAVTYGVRILANFNLETNTKTELDEFKARYSGVGTSGHVDFNYLSKEAAVDQTINCYVVGGPGNSTIAFSKEELEKGINAIAAGVTYATARPISFELQDLAGNIIETESATDRITTRKCVPHVDEPILDAAIVQIRTGENDKDDDTYYSVYLRKGIDGTFTPTDSTDFHLVNRTKEQYNHDHNPLHVEDMRPPTRQLRKDDFVRNNGGSIKLLFTHGSDTWTVATFTLTLIFRGQPPITINYATPFDISDKNRVHRFFFDKDFKQIQ